LSKGSLVLILEAHQPFIRGADTIGGVDNEWFFTALSETYLPLLQLFSDLESEGVPFYLSMVISPTLCAMLADPVLQESYIQWLKKIITLGEAEASRYPSESPQYLLAERYNEALQRNYRDFTETYGQDLLSKFSYYAKRGNIELLATTAAHIFLPFYQDMPESINAQIEAGLISHRSFFESNPSGFWLPEMGYTPGLENFLRAYGFSYSVLDAQGLLFADPVAEKGIFAPVRCSNNVSFFGADRYVRSYISDENTGAMYNDLFRNPDRDIGFDDAAEDMPGFYTEDDARTATGFKYWSRRGHDVPYDAAAAEEAAKEYARQFLDINAEKLTAAAVHMDGQEPLVVCCYQTSLFGQDWYEGIQWLGELFRQAVDRDDIGFSTCSVKLGGARLMQKIQPFMSASIGSGYGEELLESSNAWMSRYTRKAIERMVDLAERFPDDAGLKERALNLAAKEVLLAMADDWPRMMHDNWYPEFVRTRFEKYISAFTTVYNSLGANFISTEWLTTKEKEDTLFPFINYRIFRKKK
jgi:1,4-alpha-glucan branching enzyme